MSRRKTGDALLGAARIKAENGGTKGSALTDRIEGRAREKLPTESLRIGAGGELVPGDDFASDTLPAIIDTLANPDAVAADASRDRLDLVHRAGALELALDTADAMQASDGLERMLAHQMATAHACAMKAASVMQAQLDHAGRTAGQERQMACIEASRLAGAYSRLTGSFQAGMMTLQRVRSGGKQIVQVQHQHNYAAGAQTVVAPELGGRGRGPRANRRAGG